MYNGYRESCYAWEVVCYVRKFCTFLLGSILIDEDMRAALFVMVAAFFVAFSIKVLFFLVAPGDLAAPHIQPSTNIDPNGHFQIVACSPLSFATPGAARRHVGNRCRAWREAGRRSFGWVQRGY